MPRTQVEGSPPLGQLLLASPKHEMNRISDKFSGVLPVLSKWLHHASDGGPWKNAAKHFERPLKSPSARNPTVEKRHPAPPPLATVLSSTASACVRKIQKNHDLRHFIFSFFSFFHFCILHLRSSESPSRSKSLTQCISSIFSSQIAPICGIKNVQFSRCG